MLKMHEQDGCGCCCLALSSAMPRQGSRAPPALLALRSPPAARYQRAAPASPPAAEEPTAVRIQRLQELMRAGNEAAAAGRYDEALRQYDAVVQQFPEFATTEYARLARGLMLYQLGRTSDAILQVRTEWHMCPSGGRAGLHWQGPCLDHWMQPGLMAPQALAAKRMRSVACHALGRSSAATGCMLRSCRAASGPGGHAAGVCRGACSAGGHAVGGAAHTAAGSGDAVGDCGA